MIRVKQPAPKPGGIASRAIAARDGKPSANSLPSLIDRASKRLADAKSSAEVLEAKAAAEAALAYAKVTGAANETHADCLRIITRAEIRMAGEIDRGQENGEVAKPQDKLKQNAVVPGSDNGAATYKELGISRQRVNEWRKVAEAGEEKVEDAISEALADGRAPTKADINRAAGIVKDKPKQRNIVADFRMLWADANEPERDEIRAIIISSAVEIGAPVSPERAAIHRGEPREADAPYGERKPEATLTGAEGSVPPAGTAVADAAMAETMAGSASATVSPSAVAPAEPEATPSPPPASGNPFPDPLTPVVATADQAHQASQLPAQNDDVPHVVGQGGPKPVDHSGHAEQEDASAAQTGNEAGSVSGATVTNFTAMSKADQIRLLRPHCQHPDDLEKCAGSGRNHCHGCKKLMAESEAA